MILGMEVGRYCRERVCGVGAAVVFCCTYMLYVECIVPVASHSSNQNSPIHGIVLSHRLVFPFVGENSEKSLSVGPFFAGRAKPRENGKLADLSLGRFYVHKSDLIVWIVCCRLLMYGWEVLCLLKAVAMF